MKALHVYIHRDYPGNGEEEICGQNCVLATFHFEGDNFVIVWETQYLSILGSAPSTLT